MKRNKIMKSIIALILCALITVSGICTETAFAAGKKVPLKVEFNGKTFNLIKDLETSERGEMNVSSVEKKWGKPKVKGDSGGKTYTWKKGKTVIEVQDFQMEKKGDIGSIGVNIKDKNGSLWGIKVGMKRAAVLKKLKKVLGTKTVLKWKTDEEGLQQIVGDIPDSGAYFVVDEDIISAFVGGYMPINFYLKNGKVTSIYFWRS